MNQKKSSSGKESVINGVFFAARPALCETSNIDFSSNDNSNEFACNITILKEFEVKKNGKKRRITIEMHRIPITDSNTPDVIDSVKSAQSAAADSAKCHENVFLRIRKQPSLFNSIKKSPSKVKRGSTIFGRLDEDSTVTSVSIMSQLHVPSVYESESVTDSQGTAIDNRRSLRQSNQEWISRYLVGLRQVEIKQVANKRVTLNIKSTANQAPQENHFLFHDIQQAQDFSDAIQQQQILQLSREREQLKLAFQAANIDLDREVKSCNLNLAAGATDDEKICAFLDQQLTFLIEIVGCQNLIVADITSSDPYVVAQFENQTIHKTKYCAKSLNPVFTLRKNAFFLWQVSPRDLFLSNQDLQNCDNIWESSDQENTMNKSLRSSLLRPLSKIYPRRTNTKSAVKGLTLEVKDFDTVGVHTSLGTAIVPPKDIYNGKEERLEYPLVQIQKRNALLQIQKQKRMKGMNQQHQGEIAIRIRRATDHDKEFLATYAQYEKKKATTGVLKEDQSKKKNVRGDVGISSLKSMSETKMRTFIEDGHKILKNRVLPCPDPELLDSNGTRTGTDPKWMTAEEIEEAAMQPSRHFKYVGSGKIAKVYLEIISCTDLPNMDRVSMLGNKTDAFVQVVYEDYICQTPVIDDKNNPRFLPWTNRAWVLHSNYPSSVINLGVFDYDPGTSAMTDHDFIGRAAVNLTNLRPGTEYLLDYKLYDTALLEARKDNGTIKIRVRVEVDDPRAYLLAGLSVPPPTYVNCSNFKEFECAHKTCYGKNDMTQYSLNTIYELMDELWKHQRIYFYVVEELRSLLLWRGSHNVMIGGHNLSLPVHSLCAFLMAIILVEKPRLLPSISFLTLAMMLMISMKRRADHPNPWYRCHSLLELSRMLFLGASAALPPDTIAVEERANEAAKFDFTWKELIEGSEKRVAARTAEVEKEQEDLNKGLEDVGGADADISTDKSKGVKGIGVLGVPGLGMLKYYLFPIQQMLFETCKWLRFAKNIFLWEESVYTFWLTLVSFSLSLVFLFIPWFWIIRWTSRIVIWVLFGPWMKLVDLYVLKDDADQESADASEEADRLARKQYNEKTLKDTRVKNELAFKLRDFKQYFFGKFLTKVYILNFDRFVETPLASSSAKPWQEESAALPRGALDNKDSEDRETGQQLLGLMIPSVQDIAPSLTPSTGTEENTLDSKDYLSPVVSMKLGGAICIIAAITHFTVPIFINFAQFGANFLYERAVVIGR